MVLDERDNGRGPSDSARTKEALVQDHGEKVSRMASVSDDSSARGVVSEATESVDARHR